MWLFRTDDEIHLGSSFKAFTFPKNLTPTHNGMFLFASPFILSLIEELKKNQDTLKFFF